MENPPWKKYHETRSLERGGGRAVSRIYSDKAACVCVDNQSQSITCEKSITLVLNSNKEYLHPNRLIQM